MRHVVLIAGLFLFGVTGCGHIGYQPHPTLRYFLEIDQPGQVQAILHDVETGGKFIRLVEIDESGRLLGDTLTVWVQSAEQARALPANVDLSDMVIVSDRLMLPHHVRRRHVLSGSSGSIYLYARIDGVLVVSAIPIAMDRTALRGW